MVRLFYHYCVLGNSFGVLRLALTCKKEDFSVLSPEGNQAVYAHLFLESPKGTGVDGTSYSNMCG